MRPGDRVMVLPSHSLKFAGRWGRITEIDYGLGLPIRVIFEDGIPYCFDFDELVDYPFYTQQKQVLVTCYCGRDLTGQFIDICDECDFRFFQEDMQQWQK